MTLDCQTDPRRDDVRAAAGRNGLDFVEVLDAPPTLFVYFLGKLPPELAKKKAGLAAYLRIAGGDRVTGLQVVDVTPQPGIDAEHDDVLVVRLDRVGDFSEYSLSLVGVDGVDPQYASAPFRFRIDCATGVDCKPSCDCAPAPIEAPTINYLAKDYASFRQLILDRMAPRVPGWTERHVPDLGITLVELFAYVGDMLSAYQDAVATEAYLGTARQRISVRRHARLVDYALHEGCNARAWVHLDVSADLSLDARRIAFVSGANGALGRLPTMLALERLRGVPGAAYEYFEPLVADIGAPIPLRVAHGSISFYTWGRRECCLSAGATSATLLDGWQAGDDGALRRRLDIRVGDVLVFEEVLGPRTGVSADADPERRQAILVTQVEADEDSLYPVAFGAGDATRTLPTPLLQVSWARADALRGPFCLSTLSAAPGCRLLVDVSVARANNILVDHGRTQPPEPLGPVPGDTSAACCECAGHPGDVQTRTGRFQPTLSTGPIAFGVPLAEAARDAADRLIQDPRAAVPGISLVDASGASWLAQPDLLASAADDRVFVAEIDNDGIAHLRFGDGILGRRPDVGGTLTATYRVGGGTGGNVGAEAISHLVLIDTQLDGVSIGVRNPLAAQGGLDPEPIEEARLFAPAQFQREIERAITAADYATLAERDPRLQGAAARLCWSGSWVEADVAIDPLGAETVPRAVITGVAESLHPFRRMGHDLRVADARRVPILLVLRICARSGYDRGHVKAALLARFSNRVNADGSVGFFHPDNLTLGADLALSRIIAAAQSVAGVASVHVDRFHRLFELPNGEIANGLLPLANGELAQLDADPDHPERGQIQVIVGGGR